MHIGPCNSRMPHASSSCRQVPAALAVAGLVLASLPAQAHVKWFSKIVNCQQAPLTPWMVLSSPSFLMLSAVATAGIVGALMLERSLNPLLARLGERGPIHGANMARWAGRLLRSGVMVYFLSLLLFPSDRYMMLAPELLSDQIWVPLVQGVIVLSAAHQRTQAVAALGMACLFGGAIGSHGWFHMLDYVYLAGMAAFMLLDAIDGRHVHHRHLKFMALRACMAMSLLWVSVEKWMYPTWAHDVLAHELSFLTMGLDVVFFVKAAGFVEFGLAFLLLIGRAASQVAALVLLLVMAGVIPLVGVLDAVGHTPLLVALAICTFVPNQITSAGKSPGRFEVVHGVSFGMGVLGFLGMYHCAHMLAYPAQAALSWDAGVALALLGLQLWCAVAAAYSVRDALRQRVIRLASQPAVTTHESATQSASITRAVIRRASEVETTPPQCHESAERGRDG